MSLLVQPEDLEGYSTLDAIMELDEHDDNAVAPAIREDEEMVMDEDADDAVASAIRPDAGIQGAGQDEHLEQEHAPLHQHTSPEGPIQRVQHPRKTKGPATPATAMPDLHPTIHIQQAADTEAHGACLKAVRKLDAKFSGPFSKGLSLGLPASATSMVIENLENMVAGLCQFDILPRVCAYPECTAVVHCKGEWQT